MPTRARNRAAIALVVLMQFCLSIALAANPVDDQSDAIRSFIETYSGHRDRYRLNLAGLDLGNLNAGHTVIRVLNSSSKSQLEGAGNFGVLAMKIVEAPRLLVWLALMADSEELDGRLTRAILSEGPAGSKVRYQHINLPWPVKDRHWVIQVENDVDLAHASDGRIWERQWQLHARGQQLIDSAYADGTIVGVTQRLLDKSVYLPSNRGSWTVLDLGQNRTLVAAFVDFTLGGLIPDRLVRSYTIRELRDGIATLDDVIERAHTNLDGPSPIHDGRGLPISRRDAVVTRLDWKGESVSGTSRRSRLLNEICLDPDACIASALGCDSGASGAFSLLQSLGDTTNQYPLTDTPGDGGVSRLGVDVVTSCIAP